MASTNQSTNIKSIDVLHEAYHQAQDDRELRSTNIELYSSIMEKRKAEYYMALDECEMIMRRGTVFVDEDKNIEEMKWVWYGISCHGTKVVPMDVKEIENVRRGFGTCRGFTVMTTKAFNFYSQSRVIRHPVV
jgi:hypothetical protein